MKAGCLFQLAAISAGLFLVTVLALIASVFGDTKSPAAQWLNQHFGGLMAAEVAAIFLFGFAAMFRDRGPRDDPQSDDPQRNDPQRDDQSPKSSSEM